MSKGEAIKQTMATKVVSKFTYRTITTIFYALCLSGLICQVVQISMNYFQFDVVPDIKIILPEESIARRNLSLTACIASAKIAKKTLLARMKLKYGANFTIQSMTMQERFGVAIRGNEILGNESVTELIWRRYHCYVLRNVGVMSYRMKHSYVKDATYVRLQLSRSFPEIDLAMHRAFDDLKTDSNSALLELSTYFIHKLPFPYIDNCVNYDTLGMSNQRFATRQCVIAGEKNRSNRYPNNAIAPYEHTVLRYRQANDNFMLDKECKKTCEGYGDCYSELVLTQIFSKKSEYTNTGYIVIWVDYGHLASYDINSKPRIDPIDFVTYILGAFGSWLGFSFLGCNPIPYFLKTKEENGKSLRNGEDSVAVARLRNRVNVGENKIKQIELMLTSTMTNIE